MQAGEHDGMRAVVNSFILLQDLADSSIRSHGLLDRLIGFTQFLDRGVHEKECRQKGREVAGSQDAKANLAASVPHHNYCRNAAEQLEEWRRKRNHSGSAQSLMKQLLALLLKFLRLLSFHLVCLYNARTGERLEQYLRYASDVLLCSSARVAKTRGKLDVGINSKREEPQRNERQLPVKVENYA